MFRSLVAVVFLAGPVFGQISLPKEVRGPIGSFIPVIPDTKGEIVRFVPLDSGLSVFPAEFLKNPKTTVVISMRQGRYRLLAYSAVGGIPTEPAITTIIIGDSPDPGPGPGPGPEPGPGPDPSDPILAALKAAWAQEAQADKAAKAKLYGAMWTELGRSKPAAKTAGEMYQVIVTAQSALGFSTGDLPVVRNAVAEILKKELPKDPSSPLDQEATRILFSRIGASISALR